MWEGVRPSLGCPLRGTGTRYSPQGSETALCLTVGGGTPRKIGHISANRWKMVDTAGG